MGEKEYNMQALKRNSEVNLILNIGLILDALIEHEHLLRNYKTD